MRREFTWRSTLLAALFAVAGLSILIQIVRIQNSPEAAVFRAQGDRYSGEFRTYYPARGEIFDRNGHLLAGNKTVYEIGVSLEEVKNPQTVAQAMSANLGVDYNQVLGTLTTPPEGLKYLVLADYVSAEQAAGLQKLKLEMDKIEGNWQGGTRPSLTGLEFHPHLMRSYPEGALGENVLGFVTREGRGYFGVEEKYNDLLAGTPVTVWVPEDPNRVEEMPQVPDGTSLVLTIHRELQAEVETILDDSISTYGAKSGTIVVMNPRTGEILAMASTPRLDPNQFWQYGNVYHNASEFNRAVSMPYEPGSVFKILTMAAGIDSGTVQPGTNFLDTGVILVGGVEIRNWNRDAWGMQNMVGCLQHSLNVCLAWVSTQMGPQNFYTYMQRFGIGHPTGVDVAGEAAGRLKVPGDTDWYAVDLGTNAFGQGVAVTPVQMLMAASALANGGKMVTPHLLYGMVKNSQQYNTSTQVAGTPISAQTAAVMTEMLALSLDQESSLALVPGYRVAGKTGTAQIPTDKGYYDVGVTNASFIGWGPADDPQFMVYVWLEEPSTSIWGSETAAPVFAQVVERTVILLNIPPDDIRLALVNGQ
jgi:cell division protein FtsI/penicillin-binding protein 2